MILRTCSKSVKEPSRATATELAAAVAQLPLFLVPSLAQSSPAPTPRIERPRKAKKGTGSAKTPRASKSGRDVHAIDKS